MVSIRGTNINLTRGDTLLIHIGMTNAYTNEPYIPVGGDSLRFAMKHPDIKKDRSDYVDTEPLILKDIPIDTCVLRLDPDDTKGLACGRYVYDIELTREDGVVDTFISNAVFTIDFEVY